MSRIKIDDLQLRPDVFSAAPPAPRQAPRQLIDDQMPDIEKPWCKYNLDEYYDQRAQPHRQRPGPRCLRPRPRIRRKCATATAATPSAKACLLARRLVEAGTRVVEVIWPKVANSDNHSWDHHVGLTERMKTQSGPMLDTGPRRLLRRPGQPRPARRNARRRHRRIRPQPRKGRQHQRQRQQRRRPRPLAVLLHHASSPAPASSAATSTANPTRPAPPPPRTRCIPPNCSPRSTTPSASIRKPSSTTTSTSRANW